jgi:hypothetical protein
MAEIKREVIRRGLTASIGETTIWRWLSEDAIRPWHHRSWIFPRDPDFANKAGRVLDLYEGIWQGQALGANDYVISADEKTSIQARRRKHRTVPPGPASPMRVEHEYTRKGAWAYLAAWDVHRARIFGRCEEKTGITPFERLVRQVMSQEPQPGVAGTIDRWTEGPKEPDVADDSGAGEARAWPTSCSATPIGFSEFSRATTA